MTKIGHFFQIQTIVQLVTRSFFEKEKNNFLRTLPVYHKSNSFILDTEQI